MAATVVAAEGSTEGGTGRMPSNRRQLGPGADEGLLDETNRRLLAELQRDARLSLAELGRRVGLSAPAVGERLGRLEAAGVVRGYRAELDPAALGLPLAAVARVRPVAGQLPKVAELARQTPEVVECHRVTGEDCFVMKLHLRDVGHLEAVIDRFLVFGQTTTSVVQSSPVAGRGLDLGTAAAQVRSRPPRPRGRGRRSR
jgi:Lrp/AsnC family transcriptional regulator, leucine-responsive regulatory protein